VVLVMTWKRRGPRVYWLFRGGEEIGMVFGAPAPAALWCAVAWGNTVTLVDYTRSLRTAKGCVVNMLKLSAPERTEETAS
jgi:hypothetical protein